MIYGVLLAANTTVYSCWTAFEHTSYANIYILSCPSPAVYFYPNACPKLILAGDIGVASRNEHPQLIQLWSGVANARTRLSGRLMPIAFYRSFTFLVDKSKVKVNIL